MLIWRGWGILAVIIPFGCLLLMEFAVGKTQYQSSTWYPTLALLAGAVGVWLAGVWLDRRAEQRGRQVIDAKTGQHLVLRQRNQLFWIDMKWWAIVIAVLAVVALVTVKS